jgi:hypothetical protein
VRVPRLIFPFVLVWGCREAAHLLCLEGWSKGTRRRRGGDVGIPPSLRDFQGMVEREVNPAPGFPLFPPPRHFHRSPRVFPLACSVRVVSASRRERRFHLALPQQFGLRLAHLPRAFGIAHLCRCPVQPRETPVLLEILCGFRQRLQLFVRRLVIVGLVTARPFSAGVEARGRKPARPR